MLAWAIIDQPQVLLFDEPTENVDIVGQKSVYDLLHHLQNTLKISVILISHDLNIVYRHASQDFCLNHAMTCYGEPMKVLNNETLFPISTATTPFSTTIILKKIRDTTMNDIFIFYADFRNLRRAASGLTGSFLILRRMSLMSDAPFARGASGNRPGRHIQVLSHLGRPRGLFVGVLLIWLIETKTKLATESVTGVMFVTALAVGALLIPEEGLLEAFFGSVEKITLNQLIFQTVLAARHYRRRSEIYEETHAFFYRSRLGRFDKNFADEDAITPLILIALTISIGIGFVGVLLISALSIIPV